MESDSQKVNPQEPAAGEKSAEREYFFPQHGRTVTATTAAEAEQKLAALLATEKSSV